jgi:SAM-dependent methyltransferase
MNAKQAKGLRYPDEYVIKWFFKRNLHLRADKVIELGCANGNNLGLFFEFGWDVTGVDISRSAIEDAEHNFLLMSTTTEAWRFIQHDIRAGVSSVTDGTFSCLSLANIACYLEREPYLALLDDLRPLLDPGCEIFLRTRTLGDYRYGRGVEIGHNSFRLTTDETGELGCVMTFYDEHEIVKELMDRLDMDADTLVVLVVNQQNLQRGRIVSNADIVLWGRRRG